MITVQVPKIDHPFKVDKVINREESKGWHKAFLLTIGISNACSWTILVFANHDQDALDVYADSKMGSVTRIEEEDLKDYLDEEETEKEGYPIYSDLTQLGNASEYHNITNVWLYNVSSINWFASEK